MAFVVADTVEVLLTTVQRGVCVSSDCYERDV